MKSKIIITLMLLSLLLPLVYSYSDYGINGITVPQSIKEGEDLNYSLILSNNSTSAFDINVVTSISSPSGDLIFKKTSLYHVLANETDTFTTNVRAVTDVNFTTSNEPYSIYAVILNETDGSVSNNTYSQYFTVRKGNKKIPVPDMPIILGVVLAISIAFVLARDQKTSKKKKK